MISYGCLIRILIKSQYKSFLLLMGSFLFGFRIAFNSKPIHIFSFTIRNQCKSSLLLLDVFLFVFIKLNQCKSFPLLPGSGAEESICIVSERNNKEKNLYWFALKSNSWPTRKDQTKRSRICIGFNTNPFFCYWTSSDVLLIKF